MSKGLYIFAAWCLILIGGSAYTSYSAYSPFADGKRDARAGVYGPTHK